MKNAVRITALATLITAGAITMAVAQPVGPGHERPDFETLDTDGDGKITQADLAARRADRFARADTNGDGGLSLEEIEAQGQERARQRAQQMLERLDADKDGKLTEMEMAQGRHAGGRMFKRADIDGDGAIDKAEFDAAMARMDARRAKRSGSN